MSIHIITNGKYIECYDFYESVKRLLELVTKSVLIFIVFPPYFVSLPERYLWGSDLISVLSFPFYHISSGLLEGFLLHIDDGYLLGIIVAG